MKEVIFKCDICGAETDPDEMLHTGTEKDICAECLAKLVDEYFAKKDVQVLNEEQQKMAYGTDYAPKKKNIVVESPYAKIDIGKAQALRDAGWSIKRIAKEIGCCTATVYNNTHPAAYKKKRPLEWNDEDIERLGEKEPDYLHKETEDV